MLSDYILVDQLFMICVDILKMIYLDFSFYKFSNLKFSIWNCCCIRFTCQRDDDDDDDDNDSDESETKIK